MRWRRAFLLALVAVPVVWALASGFGRDPHAVPCMLLQKPAPDFSLPDLNGKVVHLETMRGRPVMLNFWATWCYPCQAEHALLQTTARMYADRLHVVGVVYQDGVDATRRYLNEHPSVYSHVVDTGSRVSLDYGVSGVPETYFIDARGTVVYKHAGALSPEVLRRVLGPLLQGGTAATHGPQEAHDAHP